MAPESADVDMDGKCPAPNYPNPDANERSFDSFTTDIGTNGLIAAIRLEDGDEDTEQKIINEGLFAQTSQAES
jgi:hypothetical protein